jgi:predicted PurR-regulated permease PerM
MNNVVRDLRPWVNFAGCVLVVGVLYWMQSFLIPVALAILLAFLLTPLAARLQRRIGRVGSVLVTVIATFAVLGLSAWALTNQVTNLIANIPDYRQTIREKLEDVREASENNPIETVQEAIDDIQIEMDEGAEPAEPEKPPAPPPVERRKPSEGLRTLGSALGPVIGPLATAALVIVLVIFLLLEREALRRRFFDLTGHRNLAVTTKAFDEAGRRVRHQLLMQALVNAIYGATAGVGLYLIGVPYAFLWASLAFLLRFVPYVGPWMGAGGPILVALAALPGWERPIGVAAMFVALELITNLVLETFLFAGAAGVSPLALLVALAFWTWLWGPMGLLMGTPLTICVVVLGKHVRGLRSLSAFMSESSTLPPDLDFYQRLLAHEPGEAADLLELHMRVHPPDEVYDALLLPALNHAERDRLERQLSAEEEEEVFDATLELMDDAGKVRRGVRAAAPDKPSPTHGGELGERLSVLAWAANGTGDTLALRMLGQLLEDTPIALEILSEHALASEILVAVVERGSTIVCIADLPPSSPSKTRYLVKKLRAASPTLKILVGRWAPPSLADERRDELLEAGASHVGSTLIETRDHIVELAGLHVARARNAAEMRAVP